MRYEHGNRVHQHSKIVQMSETKYFERDMHSNRVHQHSNRVHMSETKLIHLSVK